MKTKTIKKIQPYSKLTAYSFMFFFSFNIHILTLVLLYSMSLFQKQTKVNDINKSKNKRKTLTDYITNVYSNFAYYAVLLPFLVSNN